MKHIHYYIIAFLLVSMILLSCEKENSTAELPLPAAAGLILGPDSIMQGGFIELIVAAIDGAETYRWYLDGEEIRNDTSRVLTATEAGTYKVAGANRTGEGKASPEHNVRWEQEPEKIEVPADAGEIEGPDGLLDGETIELAISEIKGADTYRWYKDNEEVSNDASRVLTVTEAGIYRVAGVNKAGEGKSSPDHQVSLRHLPGKAGEITATHTDDGFYILKIDEIEYAGTYRWWRDDILYKDGLTTNTLTVPDTDTGIYTVAGVNEYGEGPRSQGFEIETPPATDDPMPGPNQFTYAGNVYNINTGSVDYVDWYEAAGLADIILFDESQIQRIEIILPVGESDFETWNSDYMAWGSSWWFEYYDYWEFGTTGNYPLQSDPGGSMTDGSSSITLNRSEGRVIIVADMIYSDPSGNDIHLRINYDGPATNL